MQIKKVGRRASGGKLQSQLILFASVSPVVLFGVSEDGAANVQDVLGSWDTPEHAGLFGALGVLAVPIVSPAQSKAAQHTANPPAARLVKFSGGLVSTQSTGLIEQALQESGNRP